MEDSLFMYISLILIIGLIIYIIIQVIKQPWNCGSIARFAPPTLTGIGMKDPRFNRKLYDYYVKSSYNMKNPYAPDRYYKGWGVMRDMRVL